MISRASRRSSFVTIHAASPAASGIAISPAARPFTSRSFGRFDDPELFRPNALRSQFMQLHRDSISAVEKLFNFPRREVRSDKTAWLETVKHVDRLAREAPVGKLSGEAALALLLDLLEAGHECGANVHCAEIAALVLNLHPLGWLNLRESDKHKLGRFAYSVVLAFRDSMPSRGSDFADLSPNDREELLNRFMIRVASEAHRLELGLSEPDMQALKQSRIQFAEWPLGNAGFGVDGGDQPQVFMSKDLLRRNLKDQQSNESARIYLQAIAEVAHEIVHACQHSFLATAPTSLGDFAAHQTLWLSNRLCESSLKKSLDPEILSPIEMPAYWTHIHVWRLIYEDWDGRMEDDTLLACASLLNHPLVRRYRKELDIPGFPRTFQSLQVSSGLISIAPQGHSDTHTPQPLQ